MKSNKNQQDFKLSAEELDQILEIIAQAYEEAGHKLTTAVYVDDIDENGNIQGEVLLNELDEKDIQ